MVGLCVIAGISIPFKELVLFFVHVGNEEAREGVPRARNIFGFARVFSTIRNGKEGLYAITHKHSKVHMHCKYAPNAAAKRTLRWALRAQRPLVHLPPHQGSQSLSTPLPATRLCANFFLVVLELSRVNIRSTPYSTVDLAFATILPCGSEKGGWRSAVVVPESVV